MGEFYYLRRRKIMRVVLKLQYRTSEETVNKVPLSLTFNHRGGGRKVLDDTGTDREGVGMPAGLISYLFSV